jgi:hypothetical protein
LQPAFLAAHGLYDLRHIVCYHIVACGTLSMHRINLKIRFRSMDNIYIYTYRCLRRELSQATSCRPLIMFQLDIKS